MPPSISHTGNIAELLEPAIDGPPSPGSIRAFSNQVRHASDKQHSRQSHQTTSSGSSSLRSLTSADRPSWDHTFDTSASSLSRQSSGRSITSNVPPRERHDSVQIFGRSLFGKRNRLRRESSAQSSSNSSLYSADMFSDKNSLASPPLPPATSHGLPSNSGGSPPGPVRTSFFNRRRSTKSGSVGEDSETRTKLQISGPYNFQHLTHTQKDPNVSLHRNSRMCPEGILRGSHAENIFFADFASEAPPITDDSALPNPPRRLPLRQHAASVSAVSPPRMIFHTLSQDQLRIPPPRPPRSPLDSSFSPQAPPRISSRISLAELDNFSFDRPRTSGGARLPSPLSLADDMPRLPTHAHSQSADLNLNLASQDYRRMPQVPASMVPQAAPVDDANWPLVMPMPMTTPAAAFDILPGVPEEEEHPATHNSVRKSRVSITSNSSSLRGSQSVPLLRQLSHVQYSSPLRPPSGASDTLGAFDILAAQRALYPADDDEYVDSLPKESWEDDIDYCYEHAVEADCDYMWERPSLDLSREDVLAELESGEGCGGSNSGSNSSTQKDEGSIVSSSALSPMPFDVPFLSPGSHTSIASMNEALTPTGLTMRRPGLTIQTKASMEDVRPLQRYLHARSSSQASSFKESHGFNLSPSFFIPGSDYYEATSPSCSQIGFAIGADDDDDCFPPYKEARMSVENSSIFTSRTCASTTGSCESRDSVLSRRHISTTSTSTDITHLTMSTASIEDLVKPEAEDAPHVSDL
ncbi:pak-box/p21-Rho-binding protein [Grosmannia clavigera kw1407]|uniref:Pak-box/p21-Rho-binding protein n=1 Tax=Grosmannia clavigera (strain kw1407 / UAMH 11150) TaxID=655863 RepID=F0XPU8_GROCL|nr:pak-box/p21-Rho-binding protein [Grosmannia clavigera kw1407]EFX00608.1 pak-box/p21-Rho-binding protein [Grosmannia clavigera kw1407]